MTGMNCKPCPTVLGYKEEKQDQDGLVPGGFMIYLVISLVPGTQLTKSLYRGMSLAERTEICGAFQEAWVYVIIPFLPFSISHFPYS